MSNDSILFIGDNEQNFLVRAMIKSLRDAGYAVQFCMPDVYQISRFERQKTLPDIFVIYFEGYESSSDRAYSYIKQLMVEKGHKRNLFLIGNPVEINAAYRMIPQSFVTHVFERPVNTDDMILQIKKLSIEYKYDEKENHLAAEESMIDASKKTILIVDDDIVQLHAMQRWFSKKFNTFVVNSGMDTISFLKHRAVDLILLDYKMPALSGLDILQVLRSEPSTASIPVIFLTGADDKKTVMDIIEAKPDGYILKSTAPAILVQNVEDFFIKQVENAARKREEEEIRKTTPMPHPEEFLEELPIV